MRVSLIQTDTQWESPAANIDKARGFISRAASEGAAIAILPEMFSTGFSMKAHSVAGAEATEKLSSLASENNISIIAGVAAPLREKGLNKALVIDKSGELIAQYSKMHPFSFAGEDKHYAAGDGPVVFELGGEGSSVFICYDLRFPEVFRTVARDVKVIYVLANWPASRQEHWHALLKARAIENQCFVAGVNRVGRDGNGIEYAGGSCLYGPFGEEIFLAGDRENAYTVELDLSLVDSTRVKYPFLNDMRIH